MSNFICYFAQAIPVVNAANGAIVEAKNWTLVKRNITVWLAH